MRAIFISYRRDDSEGYAGRLFQDLCERFGKGSVFMDVAGIEPGRDFRRVIEQQVASCGVLLAVIGKAWLTLADAQGRRRLDDPQDFVRLETASALKRDIPVIPVLVQQAEMPRAEQMPDDLKDLAFRNGVELTHARWDSDVELLIAALSRYVDAPATGGGPETRGTTDAAEGGGAGDPTSRGAGAGAGGRRQAWVIAPLATLALGGVAYVAWDQLGRGDEPTTDAPSAARRSAGSASTASAASAALAASAATIAAAARAETAASAAAPIAAAPPVPIAASPVERPAPASLASASTPMPAASAPAPRPVERAAAKAPKPAPARTAAAPAPAPAAAHAAAPAIAPPTVVARAPAAPDPAPSPAPTAAPTPEAPRQDRSTELFGGPGSPSSVTRTIVIRPDTKYVNVTGGEVVRFEVDGKSFIWNFNGPRSSFDLSRVAPPSVLDRKVTAYVAPNPIYRRR